MAILCKDMNRSETSKAHLSHAPRDIQAPPQFRLYGETQPPNQSLVVGEVRDGLPVNP